MKMPQSRLILSVAVLALSSLAQGCATIATNSMGATYIASGEPAPVALPYSGAIASSMCAVHLGFWACVVDIPLSLAADTAMLPHMPYLLGAQGLRYGYERMSSDKKDQEDE